MNGLTFEEASQRLTLLSGVPIDIARQQMREQIAQMFKDTIIGAMNTQAATLGLTFIDGIASGIKLNAKILPRGPSRRTARRAHQRQIKRARRK